ncbi:MAG TPA: right-handed parallel beta-helix repeat-containing protein [Dehalococcoidales bacterium]|nr:right-handed parallel beta-helix repeat-containing protein [Dehalococcoidales bacterium]
MVMSTKTPQGVRLNPQNTLELSQGMLIQTAIDTADAHGGFWVILLYPSTTYDEGDLTTTGGALITIRGMDEHVMIAPAAAPATAVINITQTLYLENITVISPGAAIPAVLVNTVAGAPTITDCNIVGTGAGYSLQMTRGSVDVHRGSFSRDVHLSTLRCLLDCYFTTFHGNIITAAEPLDHDIDLMSCNMTQGNIISNATGATVIACEGVDDIDAVTNAGTGLFTFKDCYVESVNCTNAAGEIRITGGTLMACGGAVGVVTWRVSTNHYECVPGMNINHSIDTGRYIFLHPGTFTITAVVDIDVGGFTLEGSGIGVTEILAAADDIDCIYAHGVTAVTIKSMTVRGKITGARNDAGIYVDTVSDLNIEDVYAISHGEEAIRLENCGSGPSLVNVTVSGSGRNAGFSNFKATDCTYLRITTLISKVANTTHALHLDNCSDSQLSNISLYDPAGHGIVLEDCTNVTVTPAQCDGQDTAGTYGVYFLRCTGCQLIGGEAHDFEDGVRIEGDGTGNADYNTVTAVRCTSNVNGIDIVEAGAGQSNKNIITSNQLLGNTTAAFVDGGTNTEQGHNIVV